MITTHKACDGLTFESKESCLTHEIFIRSLEVHNAFHNYVSYRGKEHIKICEEYLHIKRKKLEDFRKEHPLYSATYARKLYWEIRINLKRRMRESVRLLKALKKDWQKKQKFLKEAQTELEKVKELINKSKESKKK